ncbi:metallophosphoesterase [Brachybacterium paraconglomeratum]|uniref:metallophosphoesterase n=1 Tax=Brachybacterium paraconglomeratum TaxID=173362 RepID=UPI00351810E0
MSAPLSVAPRRAGTGRARGQRLVVGALVAALVLLLGAGWLLWDNRRLVVTEQAVEVAATPEGGLRIAHVSDLHAADHGDFQDRLAAEIEQRDVDLVALTGDLIDMRTTELGPVLDLAEHLSAVAPTFFVLGNHEGDSALREELLAGLEDAGVTILRDEVTRLEIRGTEVTVAGLEDRRVAVVDGRTPAQPAAVLGRFELESAPGPTVLLAHRPEFLAQYADHGADVVLSGHAHGGQVRLPLIGPLFAPHQGWFPALTEGVHRQGDTALVISRGLGNSVVGVRVNNPRELVVVDLLQEAPQG